MAIGVLDRLRDTRSAHASIRESHPPDEGQEKYAYFYGDSKAAEYHTGNAFFLQRLRAFYVSHDIEQNPQDQAHRP